MSVEILQDLVEYVVGRPRGSPVSSVVFGSGAVRVEASFRGRKTESILLILHH